MRLKGLTVEILEDIFTSFPELADTVADIIWSQFSRNGGY